MECSNNRVRVEENDEITTIFLDGPGEANIINLEMAQDLREAVNHVESSDARAVIVRGTDGTFCAGGDLTQTPGEFIETIDTAIDPIIKIYESGTPYVAAVEGTAIGGGLEITLACDIKVCEKDVRFAFPEASIGIIPPAGAMRFLAQNAGMARARDIMLTGRSFSGEEAEEWGLVTRVTETVYEDAESLAQDLTKKSAGAIEAIIKSLNESFPRPLTASRWDLEMAENLAYHGDFEEGKEAFLEKREPDF